MRTRGWLLMLLSILALGAVMAPLADAKKKPKRAKPPREPKPLVIGHRGASGFVPEHTLQSYRLAIKLGADYVEPDLVMTKDHVLIARHEPFLGDLDPLTTGDSTNVADHPEFAGRVQTRNLDGVDMTGFWAQDFTLAEIKTLGARQTRGGRPTQFNGQFKIPTLQEIINLVKRQAKKRGRRIGIYPETKHPTFHDSQGLSLEEPLVKTLKKNGLNSKNSPVFIQSFEQSNLKELNHMTRVRLIQLVDANDTDEHGNPTYAAPFDRPYDWTASGDPTLMSRTFGYFATDAGLDEVKTYADGIGPWKVYIVPTTGGGGGIIFPQTDTSKDPDWVPDPPTDLIQRAHARGLLVHTWTFRDDSFPTGYPGGPVDEFLKFYRLGIDGVFADFPDTAFGAREIFRGL
ncbi:MAG TPA: glycerophosphodiester phosphodiesterase [Thermoleophilaceae bacterium]